MLVPVFHVLLQQHVFHVAYRAFAWLAAATAFAMHGTDVSRGKFTRFAVRDGPERIGAGAVMPVTLVVVVAGTAACGQQSGGGDTYQKQFKVFHVEDLNENKPQGAFWKGGFPAPKRNSGKEKGRKECDSLRPIS